MIDLSGVENADDAVARQRTAVRGEMHRQVGTQTGLRHDLPVDLFAGARHVEHQARVVLGAEPPGPVGRADRHRPAFLSHVGMDGLEHVAREHLAAADRRQHVVDARPRESRKRRFQLVFEKRTPGPLERPSYDLAAEAGILRAHGFAGRPADRGARLAGDDERFPNRRRDLPLLPDDLDLVTVLQHREQSLAPPVDLGTRRRIADVGVDGIGEIDGRRAARQGDEAAVRREAEDLVVEEF